MHTVTYASRRAEIWKWYWRAWAQPAGLWRFNMLFALTVAIICTDLHKHNSFDWGYFLVAFLVGLLTALILLPLWPQIRFKSSVRSLTINSQGLSTSIGKIAASRSWKDVKSIESRNGTVVITGTNKNAFIIPARAFASDNERVIFYEAALRWYASAIA
jgi:PHD/YefM family antitoxin component YafN of YafNO toxin-antitoxin module